MAQANAEFVGHEGTTDVITFSYFDDPGSLFPGEAAVELLICLDAARREGEKRADSSYSREVVLYIVHGCCIRRERTTFRPLRAARMRRREREVLAGLEPEFDFTALFPPPGFRR